MTSKDLHNAILDANFNIGRLYIGRCSQASVHNASVVRKISETSEDFKSSINILKLVKSSRQTNILNRILSLSRS